MYIYIYIYIYVCVCVCIIMVCDPELDISEKIIFIQSISRAF